MASDSIAYQMTLATFDGPDCLGATLSECIGNGLGFQQLCVAGTPVGVTAAAQFMDEAPETRRFLPLVADVEPIAPGGTVPLVASRNRLLMALKQESLTLRHGDAPVMCLLSPCARRQLVERATGGALVLLTAPESHQQYALAMRCSLLYSPYPVQGYLFHWPTALRAPRW